MDQSSQLTQCPNSKRHCSSKVVMACNMQLFPNYRRLIRTRAINIWPGPQRINFTASYIRQLSCRGFGIDNPRRLHLVSGANKNTVARCKWHCQAPVTTGTQKNWLVKKMEQMSGRSRDAMSKKHVVIGEKLGLSFWLQSSCIAAISTPHSFCFATTQIQTGRTPWRGLSFLKLCFHVSHVSPL